MPIMSKYHPIVNKIVYAEPNTYIIFYDPACGYSKKALADLRSSKKPYKGYDITQIKGGLPKLIDTLTSNAELIGFNTSHHTKPVVFYDGKFIGGSTELEKYLVDRLRQ